MKILIVEDRMERAKVFIDETCLEANLGAMTPEKTEPEAWRKAYETLLEICPSVEGVVVARQRYLKRHKKI